MLRKTSESLDVLIRIRQEVVPLILDADKRGAVNLNIKNYPCGTPSCFMGHTSDISKRQGWYNQFTDWQEKLWQYDQGLWSGLFGVAATGAVADRIVRLDKMISQEIAGVCTI